MLVSRGGGFGESPAVAGAAFLRTAIWLGGGAGSARHESPFDHLQVAVRGMLEDRRSQAVADRRNPPTRPNRPSADRNLPDGDRTKDVDAHPGEPLPRIGLVQLERTSRE